VDYFWTPIMAYFSAPIDSDHVSIAALQEACRVARRTMKLSKPVTAHSLRNSFTREPISETQSVPAISHPPQIIAKQSPAQDEVGWEVRGETGDSTVVIVGPRR